MAVEQITHEIGHWAHIGNDMQMEPSTTRKALGEHLVEKSAAKYRANDCDPTDTMTETLESEDAACVRTLARQRGYSEVTPRNAAAGLATPCRSGAASHTVIFDRRMHDRLRTADPLTSSPSVNSDLAALQSLWRERAMEALLEVRFAAVDLRDEYYSSSLRAKFEILIDLVDAQITKLR